MKKYKITNILTAIFMLGIVSFSYAQFDDLYYNPDLDAEYVDSDYDDNYDNDYGYDDDEYDYDDNERLEDDRYDYYYSSRIRRFHRPYYGFNYFDPVYVDRAFYDPFFSPGVNINIYSSPYGFNSWNRYNRFNRWNRFNSWNDPWGARYGGFGYNNFYGDPWGRNFNRYGGFNNFGAYNSFGGFNSVGGYNAYCGPAYSNPLGFTTTSNGSSDQDVYYGSRRRGAGNTPGTSPRNKPVISNPNEGSQAARSRNSVRNNSDAQAKDVTRTNPRSRYDVYDAGSDKSRGSANRGTSTQRSASDSKPNASTKRTKRRGSIYNGTRNKNNSSTSRTRGNTSTRSGNTSTRRSNSTRSNSTWNRGSSTRSRSNSSINRSRSSNRGTSTRSSSRPSRSSSTKSSSPRRSGSKRGN